MCARCFNYKMLAVAEGWGEDGEYVGAQQGLIHFHVMQ